MDVQFNALRIYFQTDLGNNRQIKIFIGTGERKITFPQHANKRKKMLCIFITTFDF